MNEAAGSITEEHSQERNTPFLAYRPQMDGLRFLAFLGVFLYHIDPKTFWMGCFGVGVFFALSGFLITRILLLADYGSLGKNLRTFYIRRTLRIFPLYYGVLGVLFLLGALRAPGWHLLYLVNFLAYQEHGPSGLTGHFWTLSVEEQFYALFPLLLLLTPRVLRRGVPIVLLVAAFVARTWMVRSGLGEWRFFLPPFCGESLLWGCLAGAWDVGRQPRKFLAYPFVLVGLIPVGVIWFMTAGCPGLRFSPLLTGLFWRGVSLLSPGKSFEPGLALIVLGLWQTNRNLPGRLLSFRPIRYLGKISYGLYVFHMLVILNYPWFTKHLPGLAAIPRGAFCFGLTVLIAAASWHLFEAPINNLKNRFQPRKAAPEKILATPLRGQVAA